MTPYYFYKDRSFGIGRAEEFLFHSLSLDFSNAVRGKVAAGTNSQGCPGAWDSCGDANVPPRVLLCCGFNRKQDLEPILIFSEICVCKVTRGFSLVCVFGVFLLLLALEDSFFLFLFQLFFFQLLYKTWERTEFAGRRLFGFILIEIGL